MSRTLRSFRSRRTPTKQTSWRYGLLLGTLLLLLTPAWAVAPTSTINYQINASGGYVTGVTVHCGAYREWAKAYHAVGLPYRFRVVRNSDGYVWGPWERNNLDYFNVGINPGFTSVRTSIDNLGTNTALYYTAIDFDDCV